MKTLIASSTSVSILRRGLTLAAACLALGALGVSHARAQANLTFSGGLGAPLILKLNAPVTYVVTTAPSTFAPYFIFQGVGNIGNGDVVFSSVTFSINGSGAYGFNTLNGNTTIGTTVTTSDINLQNFQSLAVGNTVVLSAGTITTRNNYAGAPPASGSYQTFLVDAAGVKLDAINGIAGVPEPSTWALLGLSGAALSVVIRRRRAAAPASGRDFR